MAGCVQTSAARQAWQRRCLEPNGYTLQQLHGQIIIRCRPEVWGNRPRPTNHEIFIAGIPVDCYENEIFPLFIKVGPIYEFRLMVSFSGGARGSAYIMYGCEEHFKKAISVYNEYYIRPNVKIGVCKSVNNCRIQIMNFPQDAELNFVCTFIFGVSQDVKNIHAIFDQQKRDLIIEYVTHRAAAMGRRKLVGVARQMWGGALYIEWGEPNIVEYLHKYPLLILRLETGRLVIRNKREEPEPPNRVQLPESFQNAGLGEDTDLMDISIQSYHTNSFKIHENKQFELASRLNQLDTSIPRFNKLEYKDTQRDFISESVLGRPIIGRGSGHTASSQCVPSNLSDINAFNNITSSFFGQASGGYAYSTSQSVSKDEWHRPQTSRSRNTEVYPEINNERRDTSKMMDVFNKIKQKDQFMFNQAPKRDFTGNEIRGIGLFNCEIRPYTPPAGNSYEFKPENCKIDTNNNDDLNDYYRNEDTSEFSNMIARCNLDFIYD